MSFGGINYLAVVVAAVAGWLTGAVWYGLLGRHWMAALGKTEADLKGPAGKVSPAPFVLSFVCILVMAWVFAGVLGHLGPGQVTIRNGLVSALFLWVGFVATTMVTNHAFQGAKRTLTLIDGGHWLAVLLVQGLVLGWFAV